MDDQKQESGVPPAASEAGPSTRPSDPRDELSLHPELIEDQLVAPPAPPPPAKSSDLPTMVLIVAGLTVFDAVLVLVYGILWSSDIELLLKLLEGHAGISLLLGVAPVILGAFIAKRNERSGTPMPGALWATAGVIVGTLMCLMTLAIPVLSTIRAMLAPV